MKNALNYSHELLSKLIQTYPNGNFIDATLGKGNDIHFILNHVNFNGRVYGFDIQPEAIQYTMQKIDSHSNRFELFQESHANISHTLAHVNQFHGAIFNLGYLPNGDHSITTNYDSTLKAVQSIADKLVLHGQILIVVYSGHPDGQIEKDHLLKSLSQWSQTKFQVVTYSFINQMNQPPMLLIVEKIKD